MEACSFRDIEPAYDCDVDRVAALQGVDPVCSRSAWIVPVAAAFAADAEPRVFTGASGHLVLLEHATPNGPVLSGFDAVWGFATPLIGRVPAQLVADAANVLNRLDYYALSLSGIDTTGPLFAALTALEPVGYTDTADRCVADLDEGFERWLDRRSPRFRRSLRAADHRAAERGIEVEHLAPDDEATATATLERVLDVERRSWKTEVRSGLVDTNLGFFTRAMSHRFAATGDLRVSFARRAGVDVGYVIGAKVGDRYRGFQHSFDKGHADADIGKLLQFHAIRALTVEGVSTYDMGMHMAYKESYTDRIESTVTLIFTK